MTINVLSLEQCEYYIVYSQAELYMSIWLEMDWRLYHTVLTGDYTTYRPAL